jgi:DNA polymerase (family 10)
MPAAPSAYEARGDAARRLSAKLQELPGVGGAFAAKLVRRGITTRALLRAIIEELPRETQAHLRHNVVRSIPSAVAAAVSSELKARLSFAGPSGRRRRYPAIAVGSVRRSAPRSKDLDLLIVVPGDSAVRGTLASAELRNAGGPPGASTLSIVESYASGDRRRSFIVRRTPSAGRARYYAVDLFLATADEKPYALFHHTGGCAYNVRVRAHAKRAGYTLNQYGLFCARGKNRRAPGTRAIKTERDLARFLGVSYRPPKDRTAA